MPYVITNLCSGSRDTSCVDVCPVDAIHPTPDEQEFDDYDQLYIDPFGCIECGACAPACPTGAIFAHQDVPAQWEDAIETNARHYDDDHENDAA